MRKFAATLAFAVIGIVSPAFALYGSYALSAAPTAKLGKSTLRLFRTSARVRLQKKHPQRWNRPRPHSVLFLKAVEELSSRRPEPL
jgi:hypothetical protein